MKDPARKIKASHKMSFRGKFPSKKNKSSIHWESLLERDYIKVLEFDSMVEKYESQPIEIEYTYEGKNRRYYPDFLVTMTTGDEFIVEVKPQRKLEDEDVKLKEEVGKMYCKEEGMSYKIVSEECIRKGYFQENFDFLYIYNEEYTNSKGIKLLLEIYNENKPCTIATLKDISLTQVTSDEFYAHLFYLIYEKKISFDMYKEFINDNSIVGDFF